MDSNPVKRAKHILGGKLEDLARAAGVTVQAASKWQMVGRIPLAEYAWRIWQATKAAGEEVTMPELANFSAPPLGDPAGTDEPASRRRTYAPSARPVKAAAPASGVASAHEGRKMKGRRGSLIRYTAAAAELALCLRDSTRDAA